MKDGALKACVGYICATAIVITMLAKDGEVATATAAAIGMGLAGLGSYALAVGKQTPPKG